MSRPLALASLLLGVLLFLNLAAPTTQLRCYCCGWDELQEALKEIEEAVALHGREADDNAEWKRMDRALDLPCGSRLGELIDCTEAWSNKPPKDPSTEILACSEWRTRRGELGRACSYLTRGKLIDPPRVLKGTVTHSCTRDCCNNLVPRKGSSLEALSCPRPTVPLPAGPSDTTESGGSRIAKTSLLLPVGLSVVALYINHHV